MNEKVKILNVDFDNCTMNEAVDKLQGFLKKDKYHTIFTPNPEIVMEANKDIQLLKIINEADLVVPDGIGIVIGSKIINNKLKERVAGYDLVQNFLSEIKNDNYNVYFLGAAPGVAEQAAKNMRKVHKGIKICGTRDGYFKEEEISEIITDINKKQTDILLVGLGAPRQEKFIYKYKDELNTKVNIGVGGSFDGMSGKTKRAPMVFQKLGLEWFYRLIMQPSRFVRMLQLPVYLVKVMWSRRK